MCRQGTGRAQLPPLNARRFIAAFVSKYPAPETQGARYQIASHPCGAYHPRSAPFATGKKPGSKANRNCHRKLLILNGANTKADSRNGTLCASFSLLRFV